MIVLGQNTDDKGSQLETLTLKLLGELGYQNITRSEVGPGAQEIDVSCEYVSESGENRRVICECKAYKTPIAITPWLKFLGKMYVEETQYPSAALGYFIALSDVNGNVKGHYNNLKLFRQNVVLLTGEDLQNTARKIFDLASRRQVLSEVRRYTDKFVQDIEMAYYDHEVFWVITLVGNQYTLLSSKARSLPFERQSAFLELIDRELEGYAFIDLSAEQEAERRRLAARKAIIIHLALHDGTWSIEELLSHRSDYTQSEFEGAIRELEAEGLLTVESGRVYLPDGSQEDDIKRIMQVYRELHRQYTAAEVLGCSYYDSHINNAMLSEIKCLQGDLKLSEQEEETAIRLLRLSPAALAYALNSDPLIVGHRGTLEEMPDAERERVERNDSTYFLWVLHQCLQANFRDNRLTRYFFEVRQLREIETKQEFVLKNTDGTINSSVTKERISVALLKLEDGRIVYVGVRMLDDSPEPGELYDQDRKKKSNDT